MPEVLQKRKPSQRSTPSRRASVQEEVSVIIGIHLSASFTKHEAANLGISVKSNNTEKAGGEPLKRNNSVPVAQHIGYLPSGGGHYFTEIHCEGRPSARSVSYSSETNFYGQLGKNFILDSSDYLALRNVLFKSAKRKRSNLGNYTRWTQQSKPERSARVSNSEVVQSLLKRTCKLLARKPGTST